MPVQINEATIGRRFEEVGFARTLADLKKAGATTDQVSFLERLEAERPTSEKVKARYADEGLHATCAWLTRVRAPDVFFSQLARLDEEASKPSKPAPEKEARTPTAEKVATMYATEGRAATLAWLVRVSAENRFFTQVANIDQVAQKTRREAEEKAGRVQMRRAADRLFGKYAGSGGPTRKTGKTARERAKKAAKGGK